MQYIYLFEIKSIQAFITRTGKLSDLTNLSDSLDNLMDDVDENDTSVLGLVLNKVQGEGAEKIHFIRRKGGSIHAYCQSKEVLLQFRSVWTLLIQQMFPYLQFTDYLGQLDENAPDEIGEQMDKAFKLLNASVNTPILGLPVSPAIVQANSRTGLADVLVPPECDEIRDQRDDSDLATVRTCKTLKNIRRNLYHKFFNAQTSEDDGKLSQRFKDYFDHRVRRLDNHDIAFIHFDGNSIGQSAIAIRSHIKDFSLTDQQKVMKAFSQAITQSTQQAVAAALKKIYQDINVAGKEKAVEEKLFVFRPLVLGGDDVTLLIEPKYALPFVQEFCKNFEAETKKRFARGSDSDAQLTKALSAAKIAKLTASGGILFNKINHPAANTNAIVEGLAERAKKLTKSTDARGAAVAFYRMSSSSAESFETIEKNGRVFTLRDGRTITVGRCNYYIDLQPDDVQQPTVGDFLDLLKAVAGFKDRSTSVIQKFRVMLSELAKGDLDEAKRIYDFMMHKEHVPNEIKDAVRKFFNALNKKHSGGDSWYVEKDNELFTPIADLVVLGHYWQDTSYNGEDETDDVEEE